MAWTAPPFDGSGALRAAASTEHWVLGARQASARHGLSCEAPRLFPSGSDVVIDCGGHVFKLTAPRWAEEIETERGMLTRVAGRLGVATPEPLAAGRLDGWPYVLMSRVGGRALAEVWDGLDRGERARLARRLGELLGRLHALEVSPAEVAAWPSFLEAMRSGATRRLSAKTASRAWAERVEPFLASLGAPSERAPRLLHTEVYDEHVLVEQRSGRWELAALIDFADGRVGHPWYEIPALVEFFLRGERPLLRELLLGYGLAAHELDEELSLELCGFSLLHQFGSLDRLLLAAGAPEPASFEELAVRLYGFD